MGQRIGLLLLPGLAGCSLATATPLYPEPDAGEAARAYTTAHCADFLTGPIRQGTELEDKLMAGFQRLTLSSCRWESFNRRRIDAMSRRRAEGRFEAGWYCQVQVHLHNAVRGPLVGDGEGYFYRDGETLHFAGEYAHGWTRALER